MADTRHLDPPLAIFKHKNKSRKRTNVKSLHLYWFANKVSAQLDGRIIWEGTEAEVGAFVKGKVAKLNTLGFIVEVYSND